MAVKPVTHPTAEVLAAYGLGKLKEKDTATVFRHLQECPQCRQAVERGRADRPTPSGTQLPATVALQSVAASKASPAAAPLADLPPELVNHAKFRILKELGRGGMGVVYQAEHRLMEKTVALKVISRALLSHPEALERFHREVRAAAKLEHQHIVRALDADSAGELHLLVMEFIEGVSLFQTVQQKGALPVTHACHYARQAALGLQYAHEQGMVHRDIKPHNLMLTPKGQVKILDFGLARLASEQKGEGGLTRTGDFMGTPEYVAPEQATDARTADIRADIYSLGCTLYFLLTGRPPFQEGQAVQTILAHLRKEPTPLSQLRSDLPAELWPVAARMLAKDPAQRYQTPLEVAQALAPFCKAGSRPALPPLPPKPPPVAAVPLAAGDGATLGATSPFAGITEPVPAQPTRPPSRQPRLWLDQRKGWLAAALGVGLLVCLAVVWVAGGFKGKANTGTLVLVDLPAGAEVLLDDRPVTFQQARENEPKEVAVLPGRRKLEITREGFKSETQELKVSAGERTRIVVRLEPWKDLSLVGHTGPVNSVAFSPDGKRIVSGSDDHTVKVWDADRGVQVLSLQGHTGMVLSVAFRPDGKRIASGSNDQTIKVWDVVKGSEILTLHGHMGSVWSVAFRADGKRILSGSVDSTVKTWDADKGGEPLCQWRDLGPVISVAFRPDGKYIVSGGWDNTVKVWEADRETLTLSLKGHTGSVRSVAFSPAGNRIVSGSEDGNVLVWDAGKDAKTVTLKGHTGTVFSVAFSPDGKRLASSSADRTIKLWDAETGSELRTLQGHSDLVRSVAFSPDGQRLVTSSDDKTIKVWYVGRGMKR